MMITKLLEVFRSIPRLFVLVALFAVITKPSLWSVIAVVGLVRWPPLTRLIRAEVIRVKGEAFIKAAKISGLSELRILMYHVFPQIYRPILVLTAISMGSAILLESSLSFLNLGMPIGSVSWGRMLGDARYYISAWWMGVGPGILIFSMILAFNVLSDRLAYHLDGTAR